MSTHDDDHAGETADRQSGGAAAVAGACGAVLGMHMSPLFHTAAGVLGVPVWLIPTAIVAVVLLPLLPEFRDAWRNATADD